MYRTLNLLQKELQRLIILPSVFNTFEKLGACLLLRMAQEFQKMYQMLLIYLTVYCCDTDSTFHEMATKYFLKGGKIL